MKKQKCISLLVVLLGLSILVAGCNIRDLSTPSSRLVGHWLNDVQGWHEYYGPVDNETKIGASVEIDEDGEAFYAQYRVTKEDLDGELVAFEVLIPGLEDYGPYGPTPTMEFLVSKDGLTMKNANNLIMTLTYIDSKTRPSP